MNLKRDKNVRRLVIFSSNTLYREKARRKPLISDENKCIERNAEVTGKITANEIS